MHQEDIPLLFQREIKRSYYFRWTNASLVRAIQDTTIGRWQRTSRRLDFDFGYGDAIRIES